MLQTSRTRLTTQTCGRDCQMVRALQSSSPSLRRSKVSMPPTRPTCTRSAIWLSRSRAPWSMSRTTVSGRSCSTRSSHSSRVRPRLRLMPLSLSSMAFSATSLTTWSSSRMSLAVFLRGRSDSRAWTLSLPPSRLSPTTCPSLRERTRRTSSSCFPL